MGGDLVVDTPEGEVFWFVVFPEPFERNVSLVVGVLTFPFVDGDACVGESTQGMFGCFFLGHVIFFLWFFLLFLLFGCFFWFRSFFLLLGGSFLLWCYNTLAG
jgi:hypothetical protein